jgi:hypothetical protein
MFSPPRDVQNSGQSDHLPGNPKQNGVTRQSAFPLKQKLSVAVSWWRGAAKAEATIRVWMRYWLM